ncbi:hypothetical protein N657DRAFT_621543 [Parathielavia appendiculata]|uniref:Zn(2)-C6 fungal-type domain-containing protein n=1 Tax=Parathielavia appendiculata TaxID=2587402 RepID=A0AAN6TWU3_9PEZI|nr:hypothetical protein N657DRAFT_621543 [Parathielavia appendiculata]
MNGFPASQSPIATSGSLHGPRRRRPHRKTKTGCTECRRRRVKCDEQKPSCRACVRRAVPCKYASEYRAITDAAGDVSPGLPLTPDTATSPLPHEPGTQQETSARSPRGLPTPSDAPCCARPCAFSVDDLALLHHWTWSTSLSICRESSCADIWQRVFPEVGLRHPFVFHAILSLAALHLVHSHGTRDGGQYVAEAAKHHNEGLRGFRQSLANITEANSEALFVWSLLNMIYVFGVFSRRGVGSGDDCSSPPRHLHKDLVLGIEWIPMIRGIEAVLYPTHHHLRLGRMNRILSLGNWDDLEPGPAVESQGPDGHLCATRKTWENSSDAETYDQALRILRKCRMFIQQFETMDAATLADWGYNRAWSGPLMFVHFAPQSYFTLLHQRQPPALVLFAYFGTLLHGIGSFWFMEGLGEEIVKVVADLLGSYWRPWISWPIEYVGLD